MILIDDAGTGCFLGYPIVAGYRVETKESMCLIVNKGNNFKDKSIELIKKMNVLKNEKILVCRGNVFKGFHVFLEQEGYTYEIGEVKGEGQEVAEDLFMQQLYSLGVSKEVKLNGKEYKKFNSDLWEEVFLKPYLLDNIRENYKKSDYNVNKINRIKGFINIYPNLYSLLTN